MLITDQRVHSLHGATFEAQLQGIGIQYYTRVVSPGEASKSRAVKASIEDWMLAQGFVVPARLWDQIGPLASTPAHAHLTLGAQMSAKHLYDCAGRRCGRRSGRLRGRHIHAWRALYPGPHHAAGHGGRQRRRKDGCAAHSEPGDHPSTSSPRCPMQPSIRPLARTSSAPSTSRAASTATPPFSTACPTASCATGWPRRSRPLRCGTRSCLPSWRATRRRRWRGAGTCWRA